LLCTSLKGLLVLRVTWLGGLFMVLGALVFSVLCLWGGVSRSSVLWGFGGVCLVSVVFFLGDWSLWFVWGDVFRGGGVGGWVWGVRGGIFHLGGGVVVCFASGF
jgi:hypothetical protein